VSFDQVGGGLMVIGGLVAWAIHSHHHRTRTIGVTAPPQRRARWTPPPPNHPVTQMRFRHLNVVNRCDNSVACLAKAHEPTCVRGRTIERDE
jgi:hypothetical protein